MKKTSLKDLAREAGVSPTTVSLVLNGYGVERKISAKMIQEVFAVAQRMNYRPNQFAKGLRTGKTFTFGLIVDDIANYFFGHVARSVEEEADKFGYTVMFCNSENNEGKARNVLGTLLDKQMDGYIIAPTSGMLQEIEILARQRPVVLIDRYFEDFSCSFVTIDNYKGSHDATTHLLRQGYQNIALITNATDQLQIVDRHEGYKGALAKGKVSYREELVKKIPFTVGEKAIVKQIERFLTINKKIDSILFTSNNLGIAGLESLRNLKKKLPKDVGIICFDDNDLFRLGSPGITVVSQPVKTIGKKAVKLLIDQIEKKEMDQHIILEPNLVIRDSTPGPC